MNNNNQVERRSPSQLPGVLIGDEMGLSVRQCKPLGRLIVSKASAVFL